MDKDMEELLPIYALGALSDEERARVERYLQTDAKAMAQVQEYQATAQALSYVAQPVGLAVASKQALVQRLRQGSDADRSTSERVAGRRKGIAPGLLGRLGPVAAGASLVLAIVSLAVLVGVRGELAALQAQNAELASQLADYQRALQLVGGPGLVTVELAGTDAEPGAQGWFYTAAGSQTGFLLVSGLAPLEPGTTYQAWFIRDETPYSAGLFLVTAGGTGTLSLQAPDVLGQYDAVAVSLEPELGSLLPTGPIVLLGSISG